MGTNDQWDFCVFILNAISSQFLLPGDILVLDNASIHRGKDSIGILKRILDIFQISIWYLPTYSPELNPCELVFGYVKNRLRTKRRRRELDVDLEIAFRLADNREMMRKFYNKCIHSFTRTPFKIPPGVYLN